MAKIPNWRVSLLNGNGAVVEILLVPVLTPAQIKKRNKPVSAKLLPTKKMNLLPADFHGVVAVMITGLITWIKGRFA